MSLCIRGAAASSDRHGISSHRISRGCSSNSWQSDGGQRRCLSGDRVCPCGAYYGATDIACRRRRRICGRSLDAQVARAEWTRRSGCRKRSHDRIDNEANQRQSTLLKLRLPSGQGHHRRGTEESRGECVAHLDSGIQVYLTVLICLVTTIVFQGNHKLFMFFNIHFDNTLPPNIFIHDASSSPSLLPTITSLGMIPTAG